MSEKKVLSIFEEKEKILGQFWGKFVNFEEKIHQKACLEISNFLLKDIFWVVRSKLTRVYVAPHWARTRLGAFSQNKHCFFLRDKRFDICKNSQTDSPEKSF